MTVAMTVTMTVTMTPVATATTTTTAVASATRHLAGLPGLSGLVGLVCPVAPPGAQHYADQILGYVLWGVLILFFVGIVTGIGAAVGGRVFAMPHASKAGIVGIVLVFVAVIAYLVLPGILKAMTGSGCV